MFDFKDIFQFYFLNSWYKTGILNGISVSAQPVPQCRVDSDCQSVERCVRGSCVEACRVDPCGLNAQCISQSHTAVCTCPPGFVGHPHIECSIGKLYFVQGMETCLGDPFSFS